MIGTSYAGVQIDARRIVSVLDSLHGAIEQCERMAEHYTGFGMPKYAEQYDGRATGLRHAAELLHEILDGLEAGR